MLRINFRHFSYGLVYTLLLGGMVHAGPLYAAGYDGSLIEAVRFTLERQSSIAISKQQVLAGEGQVLSAQGDFDQTLYAGINFQHTKTPVTGIAGPASIFEIASDATTYQAGLTQKLRSGITVNPALTVVRTRDNYLNTTSPSSANVALNFTLPLQKGKGEEVTTAYEKAALLNREAALQSQTHAISSAITRTVVAYWDYLAAKQSLDIICTAEERAKELFDDAKKIIHGNEKSSGDVKKHETKLLNQVGDRLAAEQALVEARSSLGLAMGLSGSEIALIAAPRDSFRLIDMTDLNSIRVHNLAAKLAAMIQNRRSDVLSIDSRLHAAQALLLAATDMQKPQLDLVLGVGYNGLTQYRQDPSALTALSNNIGGVNAFAGVNYSWPVNNRVAQGLVMQRSAEVDRLQLEKQALMDGIMSSIEVKLSGVRRAAEQLKHARAEADIQREVYENEKKKYSAKLATSLDLFTNEVQLTEAQLSELNALRNLAQALIRVRFETGTLLDQSTQTQTFDNSRLVTMPENVF
ncbi:MAG: TolC family protein [Pseudomonadota bacterium]